MCLPQPPGVRRDFLILGEPCHLNVDCKLGEQIFVPDPQQVHELVRLEASELWGDSCTHLLASHSLTPDPCLPESMLEPWSPRIFDKKIKSTRSYLCPGFSPWNFRGISGWPPGLSQIVKKILHDQSVVAFLEAGDGCEADVAAGPRHSSDHTPRGTCTENKAVIVPNCSSNCLLAESTRNFPRLW